MAKWSAIAGFNLAVVPAAKKLFKSTPDKNESTANQTGLENQGDQESFDAPLLQMLEKNLYSLARELGALKGSALKIGQMIALYSEHFLPPEINDVLSRFYKDSPPIKWSTMEKVIRTELGNERLSRLKIEPTSIGSASLGQAYRATLMPNQKAICLKVQYPGIDKAIDTDISFLKFTLRALNLRGIDFNPVFAEAKSMLLQELDYLQEADSTELFGDLLKTDSRYIVPKVIREFSTKKIIATEFIDADNLSSDLINEFTYKERNELAILALELFFREFFEWGVMQTDPHFGNYKVKRTQNQSNQLVLLDFGATRRFNKDFLAAYYRMFLGAYSESIDEFICGAEAIGLTKMESPKEDKKLLFDLSQLILEP
ncbi:MAG: AarF/ABC1/UbiB kinase family protein, partial [Proteobacteria bacterium]|nr:AarF/ABC1/UbiB kinase family protein [Pseudomonadota bacterium]